MKKEKLVEIILIIKNGEQNVLKEMTILVKLLARKVEN